MNWGPQTTLSTMEDEDEDEDTVERMMNY